MSKYFSKPYKPFREDINVKVDLVSLKTEVDELDIDKLKSLPTNLSNLKSEVDKLDINKLAPAPVI